MRKIFFSRFSCLLLAIFLLTGCGKGSSGGAGQITIYCALDREFSEQILNDFTTKTGLKVIPKFDTEATKSVGLFQDLLHEAEQPRCDVFWNNEIINTIRLQKQGILQPYESSSSAPFPQQFKAADHTWHAFAARARVILVNTDKVEKKDFPVSILDLTGPRWRGKAALAKPQFGTTATHAACLFQAWGSEKAKKFFRDLHSNQVHIAAGNKQVAEGVGSGLFEVGLTDTDDALGEIRAGKPVAIVFPDADPAQDSKLGTLFIPNTLSLIRNSPNPEGGKKLIDYLLSAEVEAKLAKSESSQIPLNPLVKVSLFPALAPARTATPMPLDFSEAAGKWQETQAFLKAEFAW